MQVPAVETEGHQLASTAWLHYVRYIAKFTSPTQMGKTACLYFICILFLYNACLVLTFSWQYCHNSNFPYNPDLAQHTEWDEGIQLTVHSACFNTLLGYRGQIFSSCDLEYISPKVTSVPWVVINNYDANGRTFTLKTRHHFWKVVLYEIHHLNHHAI